MSGASGHGAAPPADRLIVFTRYPRPGQTKTRLIPGIGALAAAELHRRMVEHTIATARHWATGAGGNIEVNYCGADQRSVRRWLGNSMDYAPQCAGDLGRRMEAAFERAFADGCHRVVLCGTDVPGHRADHHRQAFDAIRTHDLVLGPTTDGGYWLIGLRRTARVFSGIEWSSRRVLAQTLDAASRHGLTVQLLEPLTDVDQPADLSGLDPAFKPGDPFISVVIPAVNEADHIEQAIRSAVKEHVEIIVADGGSSDATVAKARAMGAKVVSCARGRARQMNCGARMAKGRVLLFLHADTVLPANYDHFIFSAMFDQRTIGGGHYRCDKDDGIITLGNRLVNLRTQALREPWGDQAIFIRRSTFEALGGFPDVPIAEDWFLMQKVKRAGRIAINTSPVVTPNRRWNRIGLIRGFLINRLVTTGCRIGISPEFLARLYRLG